MTPDELDRLGLHLCVLLLALSALYLLCQRRSNRPNRRIRATAWPRKGQQAPTGFFADSARRPGPECAGKVR